MQCCCRLRNKSSFVERFIEHTSGAVRPGSFQNEKMKNQLSTASRILVAFASGALIAVFFLPAWRIDLFAPQYPEGLKMNIWINGLSGDVDIINGLNHYIGMEKISEKMFPEFSFLPYVVGFFMLLGMVVAITGKRKFLLIYLGLTVAGGALAMYDFYQWGYKYGHNLDQNAPIQVPGLSYQPPLIGHKRLLNFDAYSFPDVGGWVVISAAALAFLVWFVEWYREKRPGGFFKRKKTVAALLIPVILFVSSCTAKPQPFEPGKDNCHFCKMGITDTRFGGELITKKGKVFKFDDLSCLARFIQGGGEEKENISKTLTVLFEKPNEFLDVNKAVFVASPDVRTPMGSNTIAFENNTSAQNFTKDKPQAVIMTWEQLMQKMK